MLRKIFWYLGFGIVNSIFFFSFIKVYLEKEMTTHSSILAWKIPRTEEPGRLQCIGSQKLDTTQCSFFLSFMYNKLQSLKDLQFSEFGKKMYISVKPPPQPRYPKMQCKIHCISIIKNLPHFPLQFNPFLYSGPPK